MNTTPAAPLFFNEPVVITSDEHRDSIFKPVENYSFASEVNSIPLAISEFEQAAGSYPIIFTNTEEPVAAAITGLTADRNLFVDDAGNWDRRSYIPAYVRKFPFLFLVSDDGDQFTLCIEKAHLNGDKDGRPIFEDGEPSEFVKLNLEFCKNFHAAWELTNQFIAKIKDLDLLVEQRADIQLPDGDNMALNGFCVIDREKYESLEDEQRHELPNSFVAAINCHFVSLSRWQNLLGLRSS